MPADGRWDLTWRLKGLRLKFILIKEYAFIHMNS